MLRVNLSFGVRLHVHFGALVLWYFDDLVNFHFDTLVFCYTFTLTLWYFGTLARLNVGLVIKGRPKITSIYHKQNLPHQNPCKNSMYLCVSFPFSSIFFSLLYINITIS